MNIKPYRAPWEFDTKPFKIVDNVYYVGNRNVSCHLDRRRLGNIEGKLLAEGRVDLLL